jgi:ribosome-associated protein
VLRKLVVDSLEDDKAQDIAILDLAGKSSMADLLIIASGTSQRHIGVMAHHLQDKLKERGLKGLQAEGRGTSDWVLLDAGDIVVHLFRPEARQFYDLEKLWGDPVVAKAKPRRRSGAAARA